MGHSGEEQTAVSEGGNGSSGSDAPEVIGVRHGMFGAKGSGDTSGYGRLVRPVAMPGSSPRPYGGYFDEVVDTLAGALGEDGPIHLPPRSNAWWSFATNSHSRYGASICPRWRGRFATIRGCGSSCAWACPGCTIPTTPTASCTPCTR